MRRRVFLKFLFFPPILIILLLPFFLINCSKPSEPEYVDLTWKVDTLWIEESFQILMFSIWGSSSDDIYVVGHSDISKGSMWHYDGRKWDNVKLSYLEGGKISGVFDLYDIFGFSKNDIWAVGTIGSLNGRYFAIHYNGVEWNYSHIWEHQGGYLSSDGYLVEITGLSPTKLWACGNNVIFYWDGVSWRRDSIEIIDGGGLMVSDVAAVSDTEVYALARRVYIRPYDFSCYLLKRNKFGIWSVIDSFRCNSQSCLEKWGNNKLWVSPSSGDLYLVGAKLTRWNHGRPREIFYHPGLIRVFGTSNNDIWAITHKAIFHFDGRDWEVIKELPNEFENGYDSVDITYEDGWTDGNSVFILASTNYFPMKSIVFHRRLK